MKTIRTIGVTHAHRFFTRFIKQVHREGSRFILTRGDVPVAVLLPVADLRTIRASEEAAREKGMKREAVG